MPPGRLPVAVILSHWDKTEAGKIKNMPEGLNIPSGLGLPQDLPVKAESFTEEEDFSGPRRHRAAFIETVKLRKSVLTWAVGRKA